MKLLYMDLETQKVQLRKTLTKTGLATLLMALLCVAVGWWFSNPVAWILSGVSFISGVGLLGFLLSMRFTTVSLNVLSYRISMLELALGIREVEE